MVRCPRSRAACSLLQDIGDCGVDAGPVNGRFQVIEVAAVETGDAVAVA